MQSSKVEASRITDMDNDEQLIDSATLSKLNDKLQGMLTTSANQDSQKAFTENPDQKAFTENPDQKEFTENPHQKEFTENPHQ